MKESRFGALRASLKKNRGAVAGERRYEEQRIARGVEPWPVYSDSAVEYIDIFATSFPQIRGLRQRLREQKERGEKVLVVDIFGAADAASIGADYTIDFTLTKTPDEIYTPNRTVIEGDIFRKTDVGRLLQNIDATRAQISCVFARPLGGFGAYDIDEPHTHAALYSVLSEVYERLAPGGEIYIELLFSSERLIHLVHALNAHSGTIFCWSGDKGNGMGSARVRIERTELSPKTLPPLSTLT